MIKVRTQDMDLDGFRPPEQRNNLHPVWDVVYCALRLGVVLP
jgi:hypothetical protein